MTIPISYMVSEVGWLASVSSPHRPMTSRRQTNGPGGSPASNSSALRQVCQLLYCMGEDAEDTLTSTNISAADRKKYDAVISQFDRFIKVRKNVILEWALFNHRCQGQSETAEEFITSLYSLAENCEYSELKDQMICDRIVVGIAINRNPRDFK